MNIDINEIEPFKLEIERKFLVKIYDDFIYNESYNINQFYVDEKYRFRHVINRITDNSVFYRTFKIGDGFMRREIEEEISLNYFMCGIGINRVNIECSLFKKRFVIGRFELDIFEKYKHYGILEIELNNEYEKIPDIPKGIHVIKEVTNNKNYYNYYIAKNGFPEIIEYPNLEYPYNLEKMRWYCNETYR